MSQCPADSIQPAEAAQAAPPPAGEQSPPDAPAQESLQRPETGDAAQPGPAPADLVMLLESLLFVASEPASVGKLTQVLEVTPAEVESALAELSASYVAARRGIRLQRKGDRVQLTSAAEAAPYVEKFLGLDLSSKLSTAALETLAVIAYRQPITRADIEAVRGVNCDAVLRTLIARELVEPVGRLEQPGRPYLYGTTFQFLQYFGLPALDHLPPLPE